MPSAPVATSPAPAVVWSAEDVRVKQQELYASIRALAGAHAKETDPVKRKTYGERARILEVGRKILSGIYDSARDAEIVATVDKYESMVKELRARQSSRRALHADALDVDDDEDDAIEGNPGGGN